MPRVQGTSHLYLATRRATFPSMPALSSTFHGSLCCLLSDSVRSPTLSCSSGIIRSSAFLAPARLSQDISAPKLFLSGLSSRFLKSLTSDTFRTPVVPLCTADFGVNVGRFSGNARECRASDGGTNAQRCIPLPSSGTDVAETDSSRDLFNETDQDYSEDEGPSSTEPSSSENGEISSSSEAKNCTEEETSPSEKGRGILDRKRRGSSSRPISQEWRDLLTVPGIGPRNMEKLVANGIAKLDELKQLYRDKYRSYGTEKMVEFLRQSVGVQKHHATSISVFIKETVDAEEVKSVDSGASTKKRLTFCVEGNISVGKTTFLHRIANETIELRDLVEVVPEPIGKWQDVGPDHFNILDAFYGDPERYAYTFQNYVFVTRMMQERESAKGEKRLRLMERSVFSDRMVFVRAVHEAKWMSTAEISIYDSWFDPVVSAMPGLVPDAFIYLRATPDTCLRRLQSRNREEESNVTLDYLRGLHEKHEQWLFPAEHKGSSVLSVSDWSSGHKGPLPPSLQNRVLYLHGENVHSSIQKVPALVLDCDPNIDFSKDVEAKSEYARQVANFFEYVQSMKDAQPQVQDSSSLILPRRGVLPGAGGNLLGPNTLGMDLQRITGMCS